MKPIACTFLPSSGPQWRCRRMEPVL